MKQTSTAFLLASAQASCLMLCVSERKFKDLLPDLKRMLKEWCLECIVSFQVNAKGGTLDVLSTDEGQTEVLFHRIYIASDTWQISQEFAGDPWDMMDLLLKR